jgi:predicted O-methyltransferase YrrM
MSTFKQFIKSTLPAPLWKRLLARRAKRHVYNEYFRRTIEAIHPILLTTGETHNFTYDLTDRSLQYMVETIAAAIGRPRAEITSYVEEAISDSDLRAHATTASLAQRPDIRSPFGRRLGWYAVVRATKPRVVVETGVERGHGALILCAALLRNAQEGHPGRYFGTDINPKAGELLKGKYAGTGTILYGDSITSLRALNEKIDLFINDSDHSDEYEYQEYLTVEDKLSDTAIILADNAHVTDKLVRFSRERGRRFLFFREEPKDHWYPGAGIGISFK